MTAATERLAIPTRNGEFQALTAGDRGAPPVLILHGFPDGPPTFVALLAGLAARGYRAIAPWMRGYAPSVTTGRCDSAALADDVLGLIDAVEPRRPMRVIGHDWGAVATYVACARAPARIAAAVTLSVPHPLTYLWRAATTGQARASWYMAFFQLPGAFALTRRRDFALIDYLWRRWSPGLTLTNAQRAELHTSLAASWPAPARYYRDLARELVGAAIKLELDTPLTRAITVPTLYLHGTDDGCIRPAAARGAERHFRGAYRHQLVPGAGHFLALERPAEIAALAEAWFAEHAPTPPREQTASAARTSE